MNVIKLVIILPTVELNYQSDQNLHNKRYFYAVSILIFLTIIKSIKKSKVCCSDFRTFAVQNFFPMPIYRYKKSIIC